MKEGLKLAAGLLVAALLLWIVLRDVDPVELAKAIGQASILGLLLGGAVNFAHAWFRIWRWRALLDPVRRNVPFRPMFTAVVVGYATSWVVPGRLGELVRPALLSSREKIPIAPCMGTVVADRVLDGAAIVTFFVVGLWLTPLEGKVAEHAATVRASSAGMLAVILVALAVLLLVAGRREAVDRWAARRKGLVRWVASFTGSLSEGVVALRNWRLLPKIVLHSLLAWLTIDVGAWVAVRAAGAEVSLTQIFIVMPMLALGVAVPTPGGAGSYHAAMKFGLMMFGVNQTIAVGAALLMHVLITVPVILAAMILVRTEKLSWSDLLTAARDLKQPGRAPVEARTVEEAP